MNISAVLAALLAIAAAAPALADDACGPLKGLATAPLISDRQNLRVAVPVTINGQTSLMLLDTGAFATSVTPKAADEMKMPRSRSGIAIRDILGNASNDLARISQLTLGRLSAQDVDVYVLPDAQESQYEPHSTSSASLPSQLAGIFGSDFLRPYDLDLDFAAGKMHLMSSDHCEGKVIYWRPEVFAIVPFVLTKSGGITFTMQLNGTDVTVLLDTGATHSTMRADVARRLFGLDRPAQGEEIANPILNNESVQGMFVHRFDTLATDGFAISNPQILIYPDVESTRMGAEQAWYDKQNGTRETDLILGMRELRQLHVYVAYHEHKVYLSPAGAASTTQ